MAKVIGPIAVLLAALGGSAEAQTLQVHCQGFLGDAPSATLDGTWQGEPYDPLGNLHVIFQGAFVAGPVEGTLGYEGYGGENRGLIQSPLGTFAISVLENAASGEMTIYDGTPSMNAPDVIGKFTCRSA